MKALAWCLILLLPWTAGCVARAADVKIEVLNDTDQAASLSVQVNERDVAGSPSQIEPGSTAQFDVEGVRGPLVSLEITDATNGLAEQGRFVLRPTNYAFARLTADAIRIEWDNEPILHG